MKEKALLESALFLSGKAMSVERLAQLIQADKETVHSLMNDLKKDYEERNSSVEVLALGDNYKLQVKSEYAETIHEMGQSLDLSKTELKTLAYVIYKQPVRQSQVVSYRGSSAYDHIKRLLELNFLKAEKERNTYVLSAGPSFQEYFGADAVSLQKKIITSTPSIKTDAEAVKEIESSLDFGNWTEDEIVKELTSNK